MPRKQKSTVKLPPWNRLLVGWGLIALGFLALTIALVLALQTPLDRKIYNFQTCKDAGGRIAESYPEQCFIDGKSFVNDSQTVQTNYIGLTEQEALTKAKDANKPARVVERDGESLPVTMDYSPGRLNFHVKNDEIYRVDIEGED